jgi:hypothetical protein
MGSWKKCVTIYIPLHILQGRSNQITLDGLGTQDRGNNEKFTQTLAGKSAGRRGLEEILTLKESLNK